MHASLPHLRHNLSPRLRARLLLIVLLISALLPFQPRPIAAQAQTQDTPQLVNVAVGKTATQTNDNPLMLDPYPSGAPANAVDDNTDGNFYNGSVTHTWGGNHDPLDWWQVDLGGVYPIEQIDLWNRTDCCAERLHDFYVLVSDAPFVSNNLDELLWQEGVDAYFTAGAAEELTSVAIGRTGRYVRVVLSETGILSLAEVQVWSSSATPLVPSSDPANVAQGKTAEQSSTYSGATADRAVDGYADGYFGAGSVTHTRAINPVEWWQVDLGARYTIDQIDVWNRVDCCPGRLRDFYVLVSDEPFTTGDLATTLAQEGVSAYYTAGQAARLTPLVIGRSGRYVRVMRTTQGYLSLAEVQVWSSSGPLGNVVAIADDALVFPPVVPDDALVEGELPADYPLPDISDPDEQGTVMIGSYTDQEVGALYEAVPAADPDSLPGLRFPVVLRGDPPAIGATITGSAVGDGTARVLSAGTRDGFSLIQAELLVPEGQAAQALAQVTQRFGPNGTRKQTATTRLAARTPAARAAATTPAERSSRVQRPAPTAAAQGLNQQIFLPLVRQGVARIGSGVRTQATLPIPYRKWSNNTGDCEGEGGMTGANLRLDEVGFTFDNPNEWTPTYDQNNQLQTLRARVGVQGEGVLKTSLTINPGVYVSLKCKLKAKEVNIPLGPLGWAVSGAIEAAPFFEFAGKVEGWAGQIVFKHECRIFPRAVAGFDYDVNADPQVTPFTDVSATGDGSKCEPGEPQGFAPTAFNRLPIRFELKASVGIETKVGITIGGMITGTARKFGSKIPFVGGAINRVLGALTIKFLTFKGSLDSNNVWENTHYVLGRKATGSRALVGLFLEAKLENDEFKKFARNFGMGKAFEFAILPARFIPLLQLFRPLKTDKMAVGGTTVESGGSVNLVADTPKPIHIDTKYQDAVLPGFDVPALATGDSLPKDGELWLEKDGGLQLLEGVKLQGDGGMGLDGNLVLTADQCQAIGQSGAPLHIVGFNPMLGLTDLPPASYLGSINVRCGEPDEATFIANTIEVPVDSVGMQNPIRGKRCDPAGQTALGVELVGGLLPKPDGQWTVQSMRLLLDGQVLNTTQRAGIPAERRVLVTSADRDLPKGPHTLKIEATLQRTGGSETRDASYSATFTAMPKPCGRAQEDTATGIVFEGGACPGKQNDFQAVEVLLNDLRTDPDTTFLKITGFTQGSLGTVKMEPGNDQELFYKPSAEGTDTFSYTVVDDKGVSSETTVTVNNRKAGPDDCNGGGGGGGDGGGGNPGKKGRLNSWGDPHITTADGKMFDSHAFGEFIYYQPKAGKSGLVLQGRQEAWYGNRAAAVMSALAFRINGHTVEFRSRKSPTVLVDGQAPSSNAIDLGDSATMTTSSYHSQIDLPNIHIDVQIIGDYINLTIDQPLDNTYEGMFGSPNDNKDDDWQLPNGTLATDMLALADGWRITDRTKSLFTYAAGEGPETYNKPNVYLGELPTPAQLAPFKTQASNLLTSTCDTGGTTADAGQVEALALDLYLGAQPEDIAAQLCTYEVKGTITSTNPAGAPIIGADVQLVSSQTEPCTVYTNRNGAYSCKLAPLMGGGVPTVQIKVNGLLVQTFSFASKAPVHGTLSETHDLSLTRPSVRLTVRTLGADGTPAPNTTVEIRTINITRQITTGADGTRTIVLTYAPGTTSAWLQATPLAPAHAYSSNKSVTLDQNGVVDTTIDTKHLILSTPTWVRQATGSQTTDPFTPMVSQTAPATGADGTIYTIGKLAGMNGQFYRLVATNPNGTAKWVSVAFGTVEYAAPTVGPDGVIYVITQEYPVAKLYAFNPNGSLKWSFSTPANFYYTSPTPAVGADGAVYFVAAEYGKATSKFYGIDQATGTAVWTYDLGENFGSDRPSSPVIGPNGAIYLVGQRVWGFYADGTIKQSTFTTFADAKLALGPNGILYVSAGYEVEGHGAQTWAVNPNLTLRWTKYVGSYYPSVVAPDGSIYLSDNSGLKKINPATGDTLWTLSENTQSAPVVSAEGMVYVMVYPRYAEGLPYSGQLVGVRSDGTVASRFNTRSSYGTFGLKMVAGGTVYATINNPDVYKDSDLYAIPTGSTGPASGWSSAFGNLQNTGRTTP